MTDNEFNKRPYLMKLIDYSITNSCQIPIFIDPKEVEHHTAWNITSDILNEVTYLIDCKIHTAIEMQEFYESFVILESNYIKINNKLYKKCVSYINKLFRVYLEYALNNEEYETAANFRSFIILKNKNPNLINKYLKEKNI